MMEKVTQRLCQTWGWHVKSPINVMMCICEKGFCVFFSPAHPLKLSNLLHSIPTPPPQQSPIFILPPHLLPLILPSFVISALYPPRPIALTLSLPRLFLSPLPPPHRFTCPSLFSSKSPPRIYLFPSLLLSLPSLWLTGKAAAAMLPSWENGFYVYLSIHLSV